MHPHHERGGVEVLLQRQGDRNNRESPPHHTPRSPPEQQHDYLRLCLSWLHYKGPLLAPAPTARQQRRLKDKEKKKALEKQGKQALESWNQLSLSCAKAVQECSALNQSLLNRS